MKKVTIPLVLIGCVLTLSGCQKNDAVPKKALVTKNDGVPTVKE